ncbi:hypothetical protein EDC04DRAFT_720133 [Pisolithus marmoratus]|nr:hypothetical protein EDC04DRAFT_720133 [Pisolithus marmoratus]
MIDIEQCAGGCGSHGYAWSFGAELWPPWIGSHTLELNGISARLDEFAGQEIALGDYGDSLDGNFKRCGNIFEDMRELGIDLDSSYRPVVSRVSSCEDARRRLQTQNDVDVVVAFYPGRSLALHQSKGLSLPNSKKFKLLLKALSTRVESKRLVGTVVQCSEFYHVDDRGRRVDMEGALESGNRSADPGIVTPLCFIADPLTWHKLTSARTREQFKRIREHFYTMANLHDGAGTKARHKSADKRKTSGVVDFSAIFGLDHLKTFLCNELGETSILSGSQMTGVEKHITRLSSYHKLSVLGYSIAYVLASSKSPRTRNGQVKELALITIRLVPFLIFVSSTPAHCRQVNVRSTIQEIASLEKKLQATHDEDEQCALEEDITGKILWFYWLGICLEVDQLLPKVVDRIRNDADEDYRAGLRQIAEIIKRAPREIPDGDIVHLRRVMYDAGTGVSRHRLWLDARAAEQAELSRILSGKPIPATHETASNTNTEVPSALIIRQTLGNGKGTLRLLLTTFKICTRIATLMGMM